MPPAPLRRPAFIGDNPGHMSPPEPPPGPPSEVVRSSDALQSTRIRRSVEDPAAGGAAAFPLRRKIMIAMSGVALLTSALIFVAVQDRSVAHLDQEIDAKGARLVQTLASIDPGYWRAAMYQSLPDWRERVEAIAGPDGSLRPLKTAPGAAEGILQMSVLDIGPDGKERASVQMVDRHLALTDRRERPPVGAVETGDGLLVGERVPEGQAARSFRLEVPHAGGRLRFFVVLSIARIAAAKRELRTVLLVPVALSLLAGLTASWWVARRITGPVRTLLKDIDQVSAGDLGHRTTAASDDEIGQIARAFNRMTEALRGAHQTELDARVSEHEMEIASEIQANLAPRTAPRFPGVEISAFSRPSKSVGGDYYDYFEIDARHAGFIVADVAGKGVPGSLVMAMTRAFIRMEADRGGNTSPADTLKRVNRMLAQDIKKGMFVTALYCILDTETAEVMAASAGHHPMIVWRAGSDTIELANPKGIALGLDRGPLFDRLLQEEGIRLEKGDRVVMYTDGAIDVMNSKEEEFGDRRFQELCWRLATGGSDRFLSELVRALDAHQGDAPQHDDVTIVTFRYL
jgi:serine phosphatase RsbU (regulator of sigma subunit)